VDSSLDGVVQVEAEKATMSTEAEFGDYQLLVKTEEAMRMLDREGFFIPQISMLGQQAETAGR
jgi:hypothetical protein